MSKRINYDIKNVVQVIGMSAVYADEDPEHPGMHKLVAYPINLMGIAEKTTIFDGLETEKESVVVGIDFTEGFENIVNEDINFAGFLADGDNINQAIGYLDREKFPLSPPYKA